MAAFTSGRRTRCRGCCRATWRMPWACRRGASSPTRSPWAATSAARARTWTRRTARCWRCAPGALREGDLSPLGEPFHDVHAIETLERAAAAADWDAPRRPYHGRGMALAVKHANPGAYDAEVRCTPEGGAEIVSALVDTGTGLHT